MFLGWTVLLVLLLAWNFVQIDESVRNEALIALRMIIDKDLSFRAWAAQHGGVYVPVTENSPPNPYLSHVAERDQLTVEGKALTLLNPAYIMRQVYEINPVGKGSPARLVAIDPTNPVNAADPWEKEALQIFRADSELEEFSTISDLDGESAIRIIKPFYMEESCLKCHGDLELGEMHGAISSARPFLPYAAIIRSRRKPLIIGYSIIWLVGLGGIAASLKLTGIAAQELREKEARNRAIVEAIPDTVFRYSGTGLILDAQLKEDSRLRKSEFLSGELTGKHLSDIYPPKIAAALLQAVKELSSTKEMQIVEHTYQIQGEICHFEERMVLEANQEVISILRDVTEQRKFEARLRHLSFHDELTDAYNRNYFEGKLQEFNHKGQHPVSIIYADVNDLKLTNDTFGHAAGDELLRASSRILSQALRRGDLLFRVGGDEFAVLLPGADQAETELVVNKIRVALKEHNESSPSPPLLLALGAATTKEDSENLISVLKRADNAMYQEKRWRTRSGDKV